MITAANRILAGFHCFVFLLMVCALPLTAFPQEPYKSLLFYLSGDGKGDGFTADYALGDPEPAYLNEYTIIPDGAKGKAFSGPHSEEKLMAYVAPGNIYAERGTISFFWRSRDPVGKMPFKIFYVSYCDHSSLDMTWARVDYNGQGFDAFVTDANMARIRVSYNPRVFPAPDKWTHFAFSWDENKGVRLYIDGSLVAKKDTTAVFYAGLAFFTPHGRFSTPGTVTSNCGHLRGGDMDEISIFDQMLSDENVKRLAKTEIPGNVPPLVRSVDDPAYRNEWWFRYGWNRTGDIPFRLDAKNYAVRKVEIHDSYDQKKWGWRSNDGIRETVWPDAYNRSSLLGRSDYFIEPDWYCYSTSGKSITYTIPDEPWNYFEITGAAFGTATRVFPDTERQRTQEEKLLTRPRGQERTFHFFDRTYLGGKVRYDNEVRETPLAEFMVYNVSPGFEPEGTVKLSYSLTGQAEPSYYPCLFELRNYIAARFLPDERQIMVALPDNAPRRPVKSTVTNPLPLVHVLIPSGFRDEGPRTNAGAYAGYHYELDNMYDGLDGIAIDLPALPVKPTHGGYFPLNIQVKDPNWPNRSMIDFSFSVKPGEAKTIWLDTRDRLLPEGRCLYLAIAGAGADFGPAVLEGTRLRLVFKKRQNAAAEQEIDRFTQVRDNFAANMSETGPQRKKLDQFKRFSRDMNDLFCVNPNHLPGRYYWSSNNSEQGWPQFEQPKAPVGVPLWAFRQTEILKQWRYFLNWWIDNRQIENGEFGGGLSDDGDFANCIPALPLMGVDTDKFTDSMHRLMDAYYNNGMFTNGLNTIVTDALHVSEEGTNVQSELMLLEYGDPKIVERMMETSARYPDIAKINQAGNRHFPARFYSSTFQATENPWCWSSPYSFTVLHPGMTLVEFNGNPATKKLIQEVTDGYLSHAKKDGGRMTIPQEINFITDEGRLFSPGAVGELFQVLYHWTGDAKYLEPLGGQGVRRARNTVDRRSLEDSYAGTIQYNAQRMYMATEGFPWDDSPYITYGSIVQNRLGGAPINRGNQFPHHYVSWKFEKPEGAENAAILVPEPSQTSLKIIVFNISNDPINATMTGWDVAPGTWEVTEGVDTNSDDVPDAQIVARTVKFERTEALSLTFPPRRTFVVQMELKEKGAPYWDRPDLGIGKDDVRISGNKLTVTIHSLGSVDAPGCIAALVDPSGAQILKAEVPALKAPLDLKPKKSEVLFTLAKGMQVKGCRVIIDPEGKVNEITKGNNSVILP